MNVWRGSTVSQATDVLTDEFLIRLRNDLGFYSAVSLRIRPKELTGTELPYLELNEAQRRLHAIVSRQRRETSRVRVIVLKARQEGVSTYVGARFFRGCHLWPHRHALILADDLERAGALHQIYTRFHQLLPPELAMPTVSALRKKELALANGSQIAVETARDEEAGRATTLQFVHASEMALWPHADDTWVALMQAVPEEGSEVIIESTAKGVGNAFHRQWLEAEAGESGFIPVFLPWWIHSEYTARPTPEEANEVLLSLDPWEQEAVTEGIELDGERHLLTVGQLLWRRRAIAGRLGGDVRKFRQEYPSTAEEAFLVSGNPFFSEESLTRYARTTREPKRFNVVNVAGGIALDQAQRGYLRVWRFPELEQPCTECKGEKTVPGYSRCPTCDGRGTSPTRYVIGADTAEGKAGFLDPDSERGGTDFNSATVWEVNSRSKVAEWHGRTAPEFFATELFNVGNLYGSPDPTHVGTRRPALLGVERNHSSGQTVLRILHEELHYPNLFVHRQMNRRTNEITEQLGWVTNAETRPVILDELARALREESVDMPSKESVAEYRTFVRDDKGKPVAQEGCHDDRVISDAIGLEMLRRAPRPPVGSFPESESTDTPTGL